MKKTMKKNALVSSVAMLIISAIVLTSATFAWFSSAKEAKIEALDSKVQADSGIVISVDGTNYSASLTKAQVVAAATAKPADGGKFYPVSTVNGSAFVSGSFDSDDKITFATADTATYYAFPLYVKTNQAGTVSFADTTFKDSGANALKTLRFAIKDGSTFTVFNGDGTVESYKGIASTGGSFSGSATGTVDTGSSITTTKLSDFTMSTTAATPKQLTVYIWIEGNDPDCNNDSFGVEEQAIKFAMNLKLVES